MCRMYKVSIIVPLYKSEKFLTKLMDSIINQTYSNLEIILVDDGSPDLSGEIADEYAKKDNRVIVIHKENGGCCSARNKGMEKATGHYLMFADGDDWLEPDCVEYLVKLAEENSCEMSTTDSIFTTRDRIQNVKEKVMILSKEEAVASIINSFIIPVGPWNKLYTMDIVRNNCISFSVPWFGEGLYFSVMNAQFSNKVAVGNRKVYNYRLNNPNSGCTVKEVQNGINALQNIWFIKNSLEVHSREIEDALNWHIWTNNYYLINYIYSANSINEYKDEYNKAISELRRLMPLIMKHNKLAIRNKIIIIIKTLFPIWDIKRANKKANMAFADDTME